MRSVFLMPDKEVLKVGELPLEGYAQSLGLAKGPNLRFLRDKKIVDREALRGSRTSIGS